MNEEYLAEKFYLIQKNVKRVDNKLKTMAFQIKGFQEEQRTRRKQKRTSSLLPKRSLSSF